MCRRRLVQWWWWWWWMRREGGSLAAVAAAGLGLGMDGSGMGLVLVLLCRWCWLGKGEHGRLGIRLGIHSLARSVLASQLALHPQAVVGQRERGTFCFYIQLTTHAHGVACPPRAAECSLQTWPVFSTSRVATACAVLIPPGDMHPRHSVRIATADDAAPAAVSDNGGDDIRKNMKQCN
ncbi:hypothetical protein DFH27DRAFT_205949 [Peziza echinospora]|nr:hypothetical protein DFH27DRAFT_205949 [Peziza echinospora]